MLRCIAYTIASALALTACGESNSAEDGLSALPAGSSPGAWNPPPGTSCEEGTSEPCSLMLGEHDGIVSCYEGTRTCRAGVFSECENGRHFEVARTEAAQPLELDLLSFNPPVGCSDNPCNSYCREFNEGPDGGIGPDVDTSAPPLSTWNTGNLADYPPEWVVVGATEPCQVAGDCQFNSACTDPAFGGCGHSVCSAGEAMAPGCNRCADAVCAIEPNCCGNPAGCVHD